MSTSTKEAIIIEGNEIIISNANKLLWPEEGISKLTYLQKLSVLAPYLLRYCRNRYLTTIRYPDGIHGKFFYQKNCPQPAPDFIRTAEAEGIHYVHLDSISSLVWLANLAALEFHPSFNYIHDTLPAEWLLDIDPSVEDTPRLVESVLIIGELLTSLNIQAIPKTSGASGIQIYIPIQKGYTFEQLRKIGHFIGQYLTHKHPQVFTIERLKKHRGKLIYIDYLQHWYGKTLSAPYTPRARSQAPVSTPLHWDELQRPHFLPANYNLFTIAERLQSEGDLIAGVSPQSLDHLLEFIQ